MALPVKQAPPSTTADLTWRQRVWRWEAKSAPYLYVAPFFIIFAVLLLRAGKECDQPGTLALLILIVLLQRFVVGTQQVTKHILYGGGNNRRLCIFQAEDRCHPHRSRI